MLLRLKIKNFLSFGNEVEFNMFPNLKRKGFINHIYNTESEHDVPVLKQAAIYGANASGKSNLLKAVKFLKAFVIDKDFIEENPIENYLYKLVKINKDPISFEIEFKAEDSYYLYKTEVKTKNIVEALYISGIGQKDDELIFKREGTDIKGNISKSKEIKDTIFQLLEKNKNSSIFSLNEEFPVIKDKRVDAAFKWFKENLIVVNLYRKVPYIIDLMSKSEDFYKFVDSIFAELDLGIQSINVQEEILNDLTEEIEKSLNVQETPKDLESKTTKIAAFVNNKLSHVISKEQDNVIIKYLTFTQEGDEGYSAEMKIEDQSDGTSRILDLLPEFFQLQNMEHIIFIDEIENSIHPLLIYRLLEYFSQMTSKGQLIYTTHETNLLDQQNLMRPDEVWFTEKINGKTNLYSLNDFKEHKTLNTQNGYLAGRYGAIPHIGSLEV